MRVFFAVSVFLISTSILQAQVLEDYSEDWKEVSTNSWFSDESQYSLILDLANFPQANFSFDFPGSTIVFAKETVWFYVKQDTSFTIPVSKLSSLFPGDSLQLLLSGPRLPIEEASVKKILSEKSIGIPDEIELEIPKRSGVHQAEVKNFFFTALVLLLFLTAVYRLIYPYLFASMTKPLSLVNAEDFSENSNLQKFFSFDILFYLVIINLAVGLIGVVGLVLFKEELIADKLSFEFLSLSLAWVVISGALFILTLVKFVGIRLVAFLFDLGKMAFPHFFYLLRLLVIGSVFSLLIIAFYLGNDFLGTTQAVKYTGVGLFLAYILGIGLLFLIMMNRFSFKKYHLFTYLCISELVPFLVLSKIIMNFGL